MRTLFIVNPHAAGGRAARIFRQIQNRLGEVFGDSFIAVTQTPEEVAGHINRAAQDGLTHLIAVGGDGTNHVVLNALFQHPVPGITFGCISVGTGSDWRRSLGAPADPFAALEWLARAKPVPCDLGKIEYRDFLHGDQPAARIFLNIASAGVGGDVDARVNRSRRRTSMTFLRATVMSLLQYKPQQITVKCDGTIFYSGSSYLVAVANGRYFGRGMWIAPDALMDDGLFDVVLVEGMSRLKILGALKSVFSGKHLRRKDVHQTRAASVHIHSDEGPLGLDFDGEVGQGQDLIFTVLPQAIKILRS